MDNILDMVKEWALIVGTVGAVLAVVVAKIATRTKNTVDDKVAEGLADIAEIAGDVHEAATEVQDVVRGTQ